VRLYSRSLLERATVLKGKAASRMQRTAKPNIKPAQANHSSKLYVSEPNKKQLTEIANKKENNTNAAIQTDTCANGERQVRALEYKVRTRAMFSNIPKNQSLFGVPVSQRVHTQA